MLPPVTQQQWDAIFNHLAQKRNIYLTERQRAAVQMSYKQKVSILTGGPGTGKSTSIWLRQQEGRPNDSPRPLARGRRRSTGCWSTRRMTIPISVMKQIYCRTSL